MSEKSVKNFAVLVDGGRYTTVSRGRDAFADRMVTDSKVSPCGTSRIAYPKAFLATTPTPPPSFLVRQTWWREKPGGQHSAIQAPAQSVSQVSVSMKKSVFSCVIFSRTKRLFGFRERMLTSVNLREGVTLTCDAEGSLDMRTLFGRRFVEFREICSLGMGVGSAMAVDVDSIRYSREGTQGITAGAVGFLRRDKGLLDKAPEVVGRRIE